MNAPLIVWLILCLIWGSTWLFIKLGLRDLPPFTFAGLRFLFASAILWAIVIVWRRPLPKRGRDWLMLAWVGSVSIALNFGLIFWGEQRINSGLAAVLQAMIPAFGLIFAHYHLPNERITARRLAGVAIGVAGVSLIFYDQMKIEVTKTMLISLVTPVTALLIGKLTLNESLSWRVAAGSAAILAGVWLIVFQRRARAG